MNLRVAETGVIACGLSYLVLLGWAMSNTSYDVWGAVVAPLTDEQLVELCARHAGGETQKQLAVEFGISVHVVRALLRER